MNSRTCPVDPSKCDGSRPREGGPDGHCLCERYPEPCDEYHVPSAVSATDDAGPKTPLKRALHLALFGPPASATRVEVLTFDPSAVKVTP